MDRRHLPLCAAICFVAIIASGATWPIRPVSDLFAIVAAVTLVLLTLTLLKRPDKYSLAELQRVQDQAELDEIEVPDLEAALYVHCMCCNEVYESRFPMCPRCATKR